MKTTRPLLILLITLLFNTSSFSQEEEVNISRYRFLDYGVKNLPENIISDRCAVIVSVPPKTGGYSVRGDWKSLSTKTHNDLIKMGIDPVYYIYIDDLLAGPEVSRAYAEHLSQRNVKNLILLSEAEFMMAGKIQKKFIMVVTPYDGTGSFISNGQKAIKLQHKELGKITLKLGKEIKKKKLTQGNFLIPENPYFLDDLKMFDGLRLENYPSQLKRQKLAVPLFAEVPIPEEGPGGFINEQFKKQALAQNEEIRKQNERLKEIFADYPYKYEFVNTSDDKELFNMGYQYVLNYASTSGYSIKTMLKYEVDPSETVYMTVVPKKSGGVGLKTIPSDAYVYKYYVKQTVVKDVHVGKQWDADQTWDMALENYLLNMDKEFNKRR